MGLDGTSEAGGGAGNRRQVGVDFGHLGICVEGHDEIVEDDGSEAFVQSFF